VIEIAVSNPCARKNAQGWGTEQVVGEFYEPKAKWIARSARVS
jgi:hypothetical protein